MDPFYTELFKTYGPSSIFILMVWKLYTDLKVVLARYETVVTENTKVQVLVAATLERLSEKS